MITNTRRWTQRVGLTGLIGLVSLFPALTLLAGEDPLPWGTAGIHDDQKWLMIGCGAVVGETCLRLMPVQHPLRIANTRFAPKFSRGGRCSIGLVLSALAAFWLGSETMLVCVTLRAIEYAQLKPVRVRKHLMDF